MSDYINLSKNLIYDKWKTMNWVVIIQLIAFVVMYLWRLITGGFDGSLMPSYFVAFFTFETVLASLVGFVMLSRRNEQVFTSNNYRLIPVSDTKLYFGNVLTTLLAYIYLQIIEGILGNIVMFMAGGNWSDISISSVVGHSEIASMVLIFILMILGTILMWTGITVIHFLIGWISGFLPFGRQKFVTFILYFVVTCIGLIIFNFTTGKVIKFLITHISTQGITNLNQLNNVLWISCGITFVWIAIFTLLNIYLLKRWTETIR